MVERKIISIALTRSKRVKSSVAEGLPLFPTPWRKADDIGTVMGMEARCGSLPGPLRPECNNNIAKEADNMLHMNVL